MAPLGLQQPDAQGSPQLLPPPLPVLPPVPLLPPLPPENPAGQLETTTAPCTEDTLEAQLALV